MTTTAPRTTWPIRVFHYGQLAEALYNARSNRLRAKKTKQKKKGKEKTKTMSENENYKMEYIIHIKPK